MKRKRLRLLVLGLSWLVVGTVVALVVPEVAVAVLGFVVLLLLWLKGAFMRIVQPDSTRGVSRPEHLQQAVRRLLPPGTSVLQAQAEMEQRGFTCTPVAAGRFAGHEQHRIDDYLYCRRQDRAGFFLDRVWQVALFHSGGQVEEVLVSSSFTGW